jgi:hypothetical protein
MRAYTNRYVQLCLRVQLISGFTASSIFLFWQGGRQEVEPNFQKTHVCETQLLRKPKSRKNQQQNQIQKATDNNMKTPSGAPRAMQGYPP